MTQEELLKFKEDQKINDSFKQPDFYAIDDLLSEEHKLIRDSIRDWVKKEISPIIDICCQEAIFPDYIKKFFSNQSKTELVY